MFRSIQEEQSYSKQLKVQNDSSIIDHSLLIQNLANFEQKHIKGHSIHIFRIIQILNLFIIIHSHLGYLLLTSTELSRNTQEILFNTFSQTILYKSLQILLIVLLVILAISLLLAGRQGTHKIWIVFVCKIIENYRILSQLLFFVSSILTYINFSENIVVLILASLLYVTQNIFFTNCSLRNLQNYQSSHSLSLILRIGSNIHIVNNCFFVQNGSINGFLVASILLSMLLYYWYLKDGHKLFFHKIPRLILLIFCSLLVSMNIEFFLLLGRDQRQFSYIEWGIAFIIISLFLSEFQQQQRSSLESLKRQLEKKNIKNLQLNTFWMLEEIGKSNKEFNAMLLGLIVEHVSKQCDNPKCLIKNNISFVAKQVTGYEKMQNCEKTQLLKYYIKCIYEWALQQKHSRSLMIDYCEFMIAQFGDFSTHCLYLQDLLSERKIGFLQRIKATKLKLILRQQSQKFNKNIFAGKVELLMEFFFAQKNYQVIIESIKNYCVNSIEIWKEAKGNNLNEVNLSQFKNHLQKNFQLLAQIDSNWKEVSPFFNTQVEWKSAFLNYSFCIKNIKPKSKRFQNILKSTFKHEQKFTINFRQINDSNLYAIKNSVLLDRNSAIIVAAIYKQRLIFKKVSHYFKFLTYYTQEEVVNNPVTLIMLQNQRQIHDKRLFAWLEINTANQQSYKMIKSYFIDKNGYEVPCILIFKIYIELLSEDATVKFVTLLRLVNQDKGTKESRTSQLIPLSQDSRSVKKYQQMNFSQQVNFKLDKIQNLNQQNVFVKELDMLAAPEHSLIFKGKCFLRIFIVLLITFTIVPLFIFDRAASDVIDMANRQSFLINSYKNPIRLTKNYMKEFLGIGNSSITRQQIYQLTKALLVDVANSYTIKILSDQTINQRGFYPPFKQNDANHGVVYDQIDIYYQVYSSIITLSNVTMVDRKGADFLRLDSYIKPSYDLMVNKTKVKLHETLQSEMILIRFEQNLIIICLVCIFVIVSLLVCYLFYGYFKKMDDFLTIVVKFDNDYISKIIDYWSNIYEVYSKIWVNDYVIHSLTEFKQKISEQQKQFENDQKKKSIIKRNKYVTIEPQHRQKSIKFLAIVCLFVLILFMVSIVTPLLNLTKLQNLISFENKGYNRLRHTPTSSVLNLAILQRCYNQLYPGQYSFYIQKFKDTLSTLNIVTNYPYLNENMPESEFFAKQKNYLFGNPCLYSPSVVAAADNTVQNCLRYGDGSFKNGLVSYLREVQPTILSFLRGEKNLTIEEMDELSSGVQLASYFFFDIIQSWFKEFQKILENFYYTNIQLVFSLSFLLLILHFVIIQFFIFSKLHKKHLLMVKIYNSMVPEYLFQREKLIKHALAETGIVHWA